MSFCMLNGVLSVASCLLVYCDVNNKASFPFLCFHTPPVLLHPSDSPIYPISRVYTVGNSFLPLWFMFVPKIKKGCIVQINKISNIVWRVCHKGGLRKIISELRYLCFFTFLHFITLWPVYSLYKISETPTNWFTFLHFTSFHGSCSLKRSVPIMRKKWSDKHKFSTVVDQTSFLALDGTMSKMWPSTCVGSVTNCCSVQGG